VRILVVGASQGTGALTVAAALERGHDVTAFARSPQKLTLEHPRLTRRPGDFHDHASVDGAVQGHEAVIITASAVGMRAFRAQPRYFSLGTGYVIEAMKTHGVRRLVVLSAIGVGDSRPLFNAFMRIVLIDLLLRLPYRDHERQERQVMESGLDWIIARPGRLTNRPAGHRYIKKATIEPLPLAISRADVADFLVEAVETDTWVRKAVQLGG
jgi:uncharacterized protein YbjT (DUF2867 family)